MMAPLELINELQTLSLDGTETIGKSKYKQTQQIINKTLKKTYKSNLNNNKATTTTVTTTPTNSGITTALTSAPILPSSTIASTYVRIRNKNSQRNCSGHLDGGRAVQHKQRNGKGSNNKRSTTIVSQLSMGK